jgi:GT2 family glycosyltransferase
MFEPLLSIIIVNYNGKDYVDKCINSIIVSRYKNWELIVVDNASDDCSVEFIKNKYQILGDKVKVLGLDKNYGPSLARNKGAEVAIGKFYCFLDNDTEVHHDWASAAVNEFIKNPLVGIIQCKLLLANERDKIDYVGEYIGQNGFLVQRGITKDIDNGQYDEIEEILAAKSAGMFITSAAFKAVDGFDPDYFIYVEETDLGWRTWLAGYKAIFIPSSIVYHAFGTSTIILGKGQNGYNAKFHGCKNYILTLIKNLELKNSFKILPVHIFLWMGLGWFALLTRVEIKVFWWIHKAILWNILHFPESLRKRKIVQRSRKICDEDLFKIVMKKRPFRYYLNKVIAPAKVGNAESFFGAKNEG